MPVSGGGKIYLESFIAHSQLDHNVHVPDDVISKWPCQPGARKGGGGWEVGGMAHMGQEAIWHEVLADAQLLAGQGNVLPDCV